MVDDNLRSHSMTRSTPRCLSTSEVISRRFRTQEQRADGKPRPAPRTTFFLHHICSSEDPEALALGGVDWAHRGAVAKPIVPGKEPGGFIVTILLGVAGSMSYCWLSITPCEDVPRNSDQYSPRSMPGASPNLRIAWRVSLACPTFGRCGPGSEICVTRTHDSRGGCLSWSAVPVLLRAVEGC